MRPAHASCIAGLAGLILAAGVCAALPAAAGTAGAGFVVDILVSRPAGLCISKSRSAGTGAAVHVVCGNGEFVDITPSPGRPFAGTHGGAYRFHFTSGAALEGYAVDGIDPFGGAGTVTSLRIYHANGHDGPLEFLVSF